ncbi:MAG TPA: CHAP domain-containing protein, partial [Stenomitos sp.]
PEPYATPPIDIPTTWSGEGKVTPMERATNFKGTVQNKIAVQINGGLNIRSGSSTSSSLVGKIPANTELEFDSQTQGELVNDPNGEGSSNIWYHLADGRGWISAVYVGNIQQISNPTNPTQPQPGFDINKILAVVPSNMRLYAQNSIPLILAQAQADGVTDVGQIAYILATAERESHLGELMEELASGAAYEGRADLGNTQPGDGVRFKGRGYVQITGRSNYTKWSQRLSIDLVGQPTKAAEAAIAAKILVQGMRDGTFTGKKLSDYINGSNRDFYNARRIVNGTDQAGYIAQRAEVYLNALNGAVIANQQPAPATRREYIVRPGDTLSGIAQREMGNANRWREIQRANGTTFTEDEARRLQIGQKVYLPVNYQAGTGTPVASPNPGNGSNPTPQPAPSPGSTDFPGTVMYTGVNIRSGPGVNYAKLGAYAPGTPLVFDAWTRGTAHEDAMLHTMDDRWFRVKGTNTWVASAYINGNPNSNSQYIAPPSGSNNSGGSSHVLTLQELANSWQSWSEYRSDNPFWQAGYGPPNCTWYAYGRMRQLGYSKAALNTMLGNAGTWDNTAGNGASVIYTPQAPCIAVWEAGVGYAGSVGHVAVVERVNADGSILISESNWPTGNLYQTRTVRPNTVYWPSKFITAPKA